MHLLSIREREKPCSSGECEGIRAHDSAGPVPRDGLRVYRQTEHVSATDLRSLECHLTSGSALLNALTVGIVVDVGMRCSALFDCDMGE